MANSLYVFAIICVYALSCSCDGEIKDSHNLRIFGKGEDVTKYSSQEEGELNESSKLLDEFTKGKTIINHHNAENNGIPEDREERKSKRSHNTKTNIQEINNEIPEDFNERRLLKKYSSKVNRSVKTPNKIIDLNSWKLEDISEEKPLGHHSIGVTRNVIGRQISKLEDLNEEKSPVTSKKVTQINRNENKIVNKNYVKLEDSNEGISLSGSSKLPTQNQINGNSSKLDDLNARKSHLIQSNGVSQSYKTRDQTINANSGRLEDLNRGTHLVRQYREVKEGEDGGTFYSVVVEGTFGKPITRKINDTFEYLFEFIYNVTELESQAVRVTVSSLESSNSFPLLVVVRQQRGVLSWQLPLEPPPSTYVIDKYYTVSHTLCPVKNYKTSFEKILDKSQRLFVDVSTSSPTDLNFTVSADFVENFEIDLHNSRTFDVTPSQPVFYEFKFPEHVDMVLVKVMAEDDFCAMVAIQNVTCPVFDSEENVQYGNYYQTMTYQAGITVRKVDYPEGLYVVVVVLSSDEECSASFEHVYRQRQKKITLTIEEKITKMEYVGAIFAGLGYCALFYCVAMVMGCISCIREKRKQPRARSLMDDSILSPDDLGAQGSSSYSAVAEITETHKDDNASISRAASDSSLDEDDIDMLTDAESEKDIFRTKTFLYVSDLARKDMRVLTKKSQLYIWGLLTVGIFYAVPVIQLVITYQRVLDDSGNQDLCFYNFWCAHPLGPLTDFNHVFSNISYILLGILFIAMCARRNHIHKLATKIDHKIDKYYGIPQHFGLFYAMGGSLMMEGFMSACYHICPNNSNYQFDTSFMYVISVLSMLKIYQTRHPDINASASATYAALSAAVLLGVIGVLSGTLLFWIIFGLIHVIACLLLSCQIYYMGRWKLDGGALKRLKTWFLSEISDRSQICRPMYCDRMVLLSLGNAANWGLAIYGMVKTPRDFASYLLIIFLTNLLLYIVFYIIMKVRHGERLLLQPVVYMVLCAFGWGAAVFFYIQHTTTWELTPAHSRQYNQECVLLHFYDTHDIWHFLSAGGMFFGFMLLLTLDDDLSHTPREKIPVF